MAVGKTAVAVLAWVGSWKIGEVQAAVGIASGLIVGGYVATQWVVLWREKITRKDKP